VAGGSDLPGYSITMHTSISAPITLGGVPRMVAVAIGTITVMLSLALQQPLIGIPLGVVLWGAAYALAKNDPYFFRVLDRHVRQKQYYEG
jgi:type IV secretory pathway TrbD component